MEIERREGEFVNGRGHKLYTLSYTPSSSTPRALFMFHHGYGEHVGRYEPVFEWLAQAGVAVHTYDAHGHGRSEPSEEWDRHLIWDFQHMADDWQAYAAETRQQYAAELPCFIGGHSMGSLTSILVVLRDQSLWAGLICCSATVDVEWNWFLRLQASIGGILAAIIPRAKIVPAVKGEDMSTDPEALAKMEEDPLNSTGNVRARTANEFLKAFRVVFEREHELRLPIYAHHGSCDRLANISAVKRMLKNAQSTDITLNVIEGGFHEVMMGSERQDVTDHIISWMAEKAAEASPSRRSSDSEASTGAVSAETQLSASSSLDSSLCSEELEEPWRKDSAQPAQALPVLKAGALAGRDRPAQAVAEPPAAAVVA
ncbi:hypothetical protein WJX73_002649 [Symbiochloris irregularis]|uniref:Serine aminopeptidase S33 domain-containing protein n=1 Tax=Symbiochloris irregularis TaxID=706552 RepID=A0AAW1PC30_9CHLO